MKRLVTLTLCWLAVCVFLVLLARATEKNEVRGEEPDAATKIRIGFGLLPSPVQAEPKTRSSCRCREGEPCTCGDNCPCRECVCDGKEYKKLRTEALKNNRVFCLWVGLTPSRQLYSSRCVHFKCRTWGDDDRPRVIIAHPVNGDLAITHIFEGGDFPLQAIEQAIETPPQGTHKTAAPKVQTIPFRSGAVIWLGSPAIQPLIGFPFMAGIGGPQMGMMGDFGGGSSGGC